MSDPAHTPEARTGFASRPVSPWLILPLSMLLVVIMGARQFGNIAMTFEKPQYARIFYRIAAYQGDAVSQDHLATLAVAGQADDPDAAATARWMQQAVDRGDMDAAFNLGILYGEGQGVPRDSKRAVALFEQAARAGDAVAAFNAGHFHAEGRPDLPRDVDAAIQWYTRSAEAGYVSAQYNLGSLYAAGNGIARDLGAAAHWYQRAAAFGHRKAQMDLGWMYATGLGVERDLARGLQLLEEASEAKELASQARSRARQACHVDDPAEKQLCRKHVRF